MKLFEKLRDKKGQGALEYAMILAIVVAVVVIALRTGAFQNAVTAVTNYFGARVTQATT
jgi:Flp pilus assembly pilin Flp